MKDKEEKQTYGIYPFIEYQGKFISNDTFKKLEFINHNLEVLRLEDEIYSNHIWAKKSFKV